MVRQAIRLVRTLIIAALLIPPNFFSQTERVEAPDHAQQYGERFFDQLRAVFGRFQESDLQRIFESARPIECSELVSEKAEWRSVAFFNEKRELGSWYRKNFEQVRDDPSSYLFTGTCQERHGSLQVTTKYPVFESLDAYQHGKVDLKDIEVKVNAPVESSFDSRSQAYIFDLPYLFFVRLQGFSSIVYSLYPPRPTDTYSTNVVDHWECKSVSDGEVTYHFLICRSTMLERDPKLRETRPAFGASAYWILSDGKEATTTVKLKFQGPVKP